MNNTITFYPVDRVDVGIGASKDVTIAYKYGWSDSPGNSTMLAGHPAPQLVSFELLKKDLLRVTNNSMNIASLWPGHGFLAVTIGHPVYVAMTEMTRMKTAEVIGHVEELQTSTDISVLGIPKNIVTSLARRKITTVEELEALTDDELLDTAGIGPTRYSVIRAAISRYRRTKVALG